MVRFRGLHIVAGIVAMGVAAALGIIMGLNNTAVFTSSCVVYVAVSLFVQSRLAKFRTQLQGLPQHHLPDGATLERTTERPAEQLPSSEGNAA
ncbi:hypothetical protein G9E11_03725 [Arthrobacter sp. IA7]|uniref:hypothetical protein n=1 Tax=Arthrobacter ipis TaxID=2716202 RepID=UPI001687D891|nr:hypothetical protein [Arthrobacter ipis]MBD1541376.1 hypothetical protein [Arthrobacter ipis]